MELRTFAGASLNICVQSTILCAFRT